MMYDVCKGSLPKHSTNLKNANLFQFYNKQCTMTFPSESHKTSPAEYAPDFWKVADSTPGGSSDFPKSLKITSF